MAPMSSYARTLFLHPPSFQGFDGGAGSRYQARREVRSFWYPTWLAQPAALVPGSRLVDAPPADLTLADILPLAREFILGVLRKIAKRRRCTQRPGQLHGQLVFERPQLSDNLVLTGQFLLFAHCRCILSTN